MTDFSLPGFGPLAWIDVVLLGWFVLVGLSVVYVAHDVFAKNPEVPVMRWAWVLVTLYTGPLGAALYILVSKEPRPGTHEEFIKPLWKQAVGSTIHCVAGDATGIIIAATVTALLGFPMWLDIGIEYAFGFAFGLFIFQSLFMKDMMGGSYRQAVKLSFLPEWLSMNMMMAGRIASRKNLTRRGLLPQERSYRVTPSLWEGSRCPTPESEDRARYPLIVYDVINARKLPRRADLVFDRSDARTPQGRAIVTPSLRHGGSVMAAVLTEEPGRDADRPPPGLPAQGQPVGGG